MLGLYPGRHDFCQRRERDWGSDSPGYGACGQGRCHHCCGMCSSLSHQGLAALYLVAVCAAIFSSLHGDADSQYLSKVTLYSVAVGVVHGNCSGSVNVNHNQGRLVMPAMSCQPCHALTLVTVMPIAPGMVGAQHRSCLRCSCNRVVIFTAGQHDLTVQ